MAQIEGSIIDNRSETGSDDTMYHANKAIIPPVATPVIVKMYPVTGPEIAARTKCMDTDN